MKTDQLIALLATGVEPVDADVVRRRFARALGSSAMFAILLMLMLLGVRPDLVAAAQLPMFWVKLAFPALLVAGGLVAVVRLSRPGVRLGGAPAAIAAPVLAIWMLAALVLMNAVPAERSSLIFGGTWIFCLLTITALALPIFIGALWAMKGLAPTRLALAGGAAGLLAGAGGALVYALHCTEMAPSFLAIWYVIGMAIPSAVGTAIGPRVLRW